jgi:CRISPR/Cas system CMR-associated protein Cmr5 small subunit
MSGEEAVEVFSSFADQATDMMTTNVDGKSAMAAFGTSTADDISNDNEEASSNKKAGGGANNAYDAYENDEDDDM